MKEFNDIDDAKKEGLRIMAAVHEFCVKNSIKYSLFYGSLLGAVRHNGYIPWDDDIDVAMPREDYERFITSFGDELFGVMTCYNNKYYYLPYAKVYSKNTLKLEDIRVHKKFSIGFNIDIFPLDLFSNIDNFHKAKKKEEKLLKKSNLSILPNKIDSFKTFIVSLISIPLWMARSYNRCSKKLDTFFINYDKNNSEKKYYVGNETNGYETELAFDSDIFDDLSLHDFENYQFFITNKYDSVLKQRYGDYMKLPPQNQRITHHNFKAFFK